MFRGRKKNREDKEEVLPDMRGLEMLGRILLVVLRRFTEKGALLGRETEAHLQSAWWGVVEYGSNVDKVCLG